MRLIRLASVTAVALFAGASLLPANAGAAVTLTGDGSTLIAPLEAEWAVAFQAFRSDETVNFVANGSQSGINDITSRAVDFAASDAPMSTAQLDACRGCYELPWALTGIGIGYRIDGLKANLYLDGSVLAQIFLGQITRWNDHRIKALNPRAHLPNLAITPIYSGNAGTTYPFTRYLSKVSQTWRTTVGSGVNVAFPTGVSAKSTAATVSLLRSTNGAISYIAAAYLIDERLPAAAIENAAGRFEYPNLSEVESAGSSFSGAVSTSSLDVTNPPRKATIAYPISAYTYVIVAANATQKSSLEDWLSYVLSAGQQFGPQLDFAALPKKVLHASDAIYSAWAGA